MTCRRSRCLPCGRTIETSLVVDVPLEFGSIKSGILLFQFRAERLHGETPCGSGIRGRSLIRIFATRRKSFLVRVPPFDKEVEIEFEFFLALLRRRSNQTQ